MTVHDIPFDPSEMLVGGVWRKAASADRLSVEDPSTGDTFAEISAGAGADMEEAIAAARAAFNGAWGAMSALERGRALTRMSLAVLAQADLLARLEAIDVGKPLRQAKADALALARYLEYYGGAADKVHGDVIPYQNGYTVMAVRVPFGVTGHIIPWNYPMQIVGRSVAAALAMGNAAVLKPAEEASLTALAFGRIAMDAGLPAGALNIVTGPGETTGSALTHHPGIDHLSFTGSVEVGARVQAAAACHVGPVTLELGGKSPHIVFADADLDQAVPVIVNSAIQNAGQTCSAGSRVLVQSAIAEALIARLAERFGALRAGPALGDHDLGPVISARQKASIERYVDAAAAEGVRFPGRGDVIADAPKGGFYVRPTLAAPVDPGHILAREEIFGPVQVVSVFQNEEEAVALANGLDYGLVAGVWTRDGGRALRVANRVRAGQVFINNYGAGGGVELPFGGFGKSGHGREKGMEGLLSASTVKTIALFHGGET